MYTDFNKFLLSEQKVYDAQKYNYACHLTFIP